MDPLAKALVGDLRSGFSEMVDEVGPSLFSGLRRMSGSREEAEDLTQEALIRAYLALSGYEKERIEALSVRPWLWTIALNLGRNHLRDRARRPLPAPFEETGVEDPEPPDAASWDRRLGRLSSAQRNAVVLRHVAGLGISEISQVTGRAEGTVKSDIHRGLNGLREIMEEEERDGT